MSFRDRFLGAMARREVDECARHGVLLLEGQLWISSFYTSSPASPWFPVIFRVPVNQTDPLGIGGTFGPVRRGSRWLRPPG
jgi:hypothetical protein